MIQCEITGMIYETSPIKKKPLNNKNNNMNNDIKSIENGSKLDRIKRTRASFKYGSKISRKIKQVKNKVQQQFGDKQHTNLNDEIEEVRVINHIKHLSREQLEKQYIAKIYQLEHLKGLLRSENHTQRQIKLHL